MNIGVVGPYGKIGSELITYWGCVPLACDITSVDSIYKSILEYEPDVIINCAAMTQVDEIQSNFQSGEEGGISQQAIQVNSFGPVTLLETFSGPVIHLSTDYVFSGTKGPYQEKSKYDGDAINFYGQTKKLGEQLFFGKENGYVVRVTGCYGRTVHNDLVKHIIRTLMDGDYYYAAHDIVSNYTYIPFLAKNLIDMAKIVCSTDLSDRVYHMASPDLMSRYDFALQVASVFHLDGDLIIPIASEEIEGWVAKRPKRGGLYTKQTRNSFPFPKIINGLRRLAEEKDYAV